MIVLSHFDRPKGKVVPVHVAEGAAGAAVATRSAGKVAFAEDCIGPTAEAAVAALKDGDVLLLENTRFHKGEEENDPAMAEAAGGAGRHLCQ